MGSNAAAVEKTEEDLRKEIDELQRQQREVFLILLLLLLLLHVFLCVYFFLCFVFSFLWIFIDALMLFQITERLRDPRGLRRGGFPGPGPRNFAANGPRRGFVRPVI